MHMSKHTLVVQIVSVKMCIVLWFVIYELYFDLVHLLGGWSPQFIELKVYCFFGVGIVRLVIKV